VKRLLRLYPSAWRERYEEEVGELLDELPTNRSMVLDLVRSAFLERARAVWRLIPANPIPAGGLPMLTHPLQRHPTSLALLALLMVAPTFLFVAVSLLAYQIGVPGLAAAVEPRLAAFTASGWVDPFLLAAPLLAFLVAVVPLVGIGAGRADGALHVTISLRARALNVAVLILCALVGGLLVAYLVSEFLLEAAR
jgi:hypothetical protein